MTTEIKKAKNNNEVKTRNINYWSIILLVVLLVGFTLIDTKMFTSPVRFLSIANINTMLTNIAPLLLMVCGVTFVLLTGGIDLSIGAMASVSSCLIVATSSMGWWSLIFAIIYGVVAGAINGIAVSKLKIPSFIGTLGFQSVWYGVAYYTIGGQATMVPKAISDEIFGSWYGVHLFGDIIPSETDFLNMSVVIAVVIMILFWVVQSKTSLGKNIFAVGVNERAARVCGVNVDKARIWAFVMCGIGCALCGLYLTANNKSGNPILGEPYDLKGVAAAVLGGASLSGGKGSIWGALLGSALIIIIETALPIIGVDAYWQKVVIGALMIAAVFMTTDRKGRDTVIK